MVTFHQMAFWSIVNFEYGIFFIFFLFTTNRSKLVYALNDNRLQYYIFKALLFSCRHLFFIFFLVVYRLHRVKLDTGNSIYRDVRIDVKTYLINYTGFDIFLQVWSEEVISHQLLLVKVYFVKLNENSPSSLYVIFESRQ